MPISIIFIAASANGQRIISLAPDLTEIIYAAGAGNKLVAVSNHSDYPPAAATLPQVASYNHLDIEQILLLKPDLIITKNYAATAQPLQQLAAEGIPILTVDIKQLADIAKAIRVIGKRTGTEQQARKAAAKFMADLNQLKQHYHRRQRIRTLYLIWTQPLLTINRNSVINQVITLCGGQNVFADSFGSAPEINVEAIVAANPEVIFYPQTAQQSVLALLKPWPQISAVAKQQLYAVDANLLNRAGPRLLQGAKYLCQTLATANESLIPSA